MSLTAEMSDNLDANSKKRQISPSHGESPETKRLFTFDSPDGSMAGSSVSMPSDEAPNIEWFKALFAKMDGMKMAIDFNNKELLVCKTDINSLKSNVQQLQSKLIALERENMELKRLSTIQSEKNVKTEIHRREFNVIFEGIEETTGEDSLLLNGKVVKALNHMEIFGGKAAEVLMVRCQRIGAPVGGGVRPVLCQFLRHNDVITLLRNRKQLPNKIFVREDYPPEIEERRRILRPIFNKAKKSAKYKGKCRLIVDRLVINSKVFTVEPVNNLNDLPEELNPRRTAEKENDELLVFFTQASPFSNFHPSVFEKDGVKYMCNEQYIQAKKAEIFDDDNSHALIMRSSNPYEMKKIGGRIRNFVGQIWTREAEAIAFQGCMAKFSQNEQLETALLNSGNKLLGEASKDIWWGVGTTLESVEVLHKDSWTGDNLMGKVLMAVREELKSK